MKKKLVIIALGGNALLKSGQKGSIAEQNLNVRETLHGLYPIIKEGHNIIITHGNGPQVGFILLKNDAGEQVYGIPRVPSGCSSQLRYTDAEIGYLDSKVNCSVLLHTIHGIVYVRYISRILQ